MSDVESLENMLSYIPGAVHLYVLDDGLTILEESASFQMLFGYSGEEIKEKFHNHYLDMVYEDDREYVSSEIRRQLEEGDAIAVDYRIRKKNGTVAWVYDQGRLAGGPDGRSVIYSMLSDITEDRAEREELRLSLERHRFILDQAEDVIFEWDIRRDSMIYSVNWHKKFGYEPIHEDVVKRLPDSENFHPDDIPLIVKLLEDIRAGAPFGEVEVRIRDVAGHDAYCRIRARLQKDAQGRPLKAIGVISDVGEERKAGQELYEQSQKDALTGLLNRKACRQKVNEFISARPKLQGIMLLIDLDRFKQINESYGHLHGDALLSDLSGELRRIFRSDDIIGRIGGDEFLVYLPAVSMQNMEKRLPQIHERLRSVSISGGKETVSCSVGVSCYPVNGASFSKLYQCADKALSYVKTHGKGHFMFYADQMEGETVPHNPVEAVRDLLNYEEDGVYEWLAQYSFRMLYEAHDVIEALKRLIEIVGRSYDVSRVYVFENSEDGLNCTNTLQWCNSGVRPQTYQMQNLALKDMNQYQSNFDDNGIFSCSRIGDLEPKLRTFFGLVGTKAFLQCAVCDQNEYKGFIGFDECRENRFWTKEQIDSLGLIAKVLGTFLEKQRLHEKAERLKETDHTS